MGFRFRKSVKIAPGVRLNIGKKSVGISAGVKGARVSVNSSGRKTTTVGLPGTGLSYSKTEKIGGRKTTTRSASSNNAQPIRPDLPPAQPLEEKKKKGCCGCAVYAFIALLIIGALGSCIGGTEDKDKQTDTGDGTQAAVITQLTLTGDPIAEIDLGSSQTLTYTVDPSDFAMTADTVYATTSDSNVLAVSAECLSDPARVEVTLTGKAAGTADYTVRAAEGDAQQTGQITVHDRAAEQAAAKAKAEKEAAEKAAAEKAAQEQAAAEAAAAQQAAQEQAAAQQSETVYITPSGKRWHRSASCAGKNARAVTMDQVGGRTPCQKCAS